MDRIRLGAILGALMLALAVDAGAQGLASSPAVSVAVGDSDASPHDTGLPVAIPTRRDTASLVPAVQSGAAVSLAIVAGVALLALLRRQRGRKAAGRWAAWWRPVARAAGPRHLEHIALTRHASVHVVQWHGEELLLASTAQSVTLLARRDAPQSRAAHEQEDMA